MSTKENDTTAENSINGNKPYRTQNHQRDGLVNLKNLLYRWQGNKKSQHPERRKTTRLIYPAGRRPLLKIREYTFEVLNISVKGLKFLNPLGRKIGDNVFGTIHLTRGKSIDIRGRIKWQQGNEMGLLASRISEQVIAEEVRMLLRSFGGDAEKKAPLPSPQDTESVAISKKRIRAIASVFWRYLNKDSKDTFLDAEIMDATRWVLRFLNQDLVGQKIVILEKEKLKTASAVARMLKRQRHIIRTGTHKKAIAEIKQISVYLSHPFWANSGVIRDTKRYLDRNARKMTPETMRKLRTKIEGLKPYFDGTLLDHTLIKSSKSLRQIAMDFCFTEFAVCAKHEIPVVKDRNGNILCQFTDCGTKACPFEASKAHGVETAFISGLERRMATQPGSQTAA